MTGFSSPNHTQTPNDLFDRYMPLMGEAELKVTLAVVRKTLGYQKKRDPISLSQLETITGLSHQAVIDGADAAVQRGVIAIVGQGKRGVNIYELVVEVDQSTQETSTSQPGRPDLVNQVDSQKKIYKRKSTKEKTLAAEAASAPPSLETEQSSESSDQTPNPVPAAPSPVAPSWKPADLVYYAYDHGWGGGAVGQACAFVLSVTAKKVNILLHNARHNHHEEKSVSPTKLSVRELAFPLVDDKGWELLGQRYVQPHIALIEAYHYALPEDIRPPGKPNFGRHSAVAVELAEAGIALFDVVRFVVERSPSYILWARQNKRSGIMSLEHVKNNIKDFLAESKTNGLSANAAAQAKGRAAGETGADQSANGKAGAGKGDADTFKVPEGWGGIGVVK